MARPATGTIIEKTNAQGETLRTLRFPVNGRKRAVALGRVSHAEAEQRLVLELARVADGSWTPPAPVAVSARADVPTFHEFADEWWLLKREELNEDTQADYKTRLEKHLLGFFGPMPLDAIDFAAIERYVARKLAQTTPKLSPRRINMTLVLLSAILERARKRRLIDANPAADSDLRVKERTPPRSYLDSAAQISALLDAAGELDAKAPTDRRHIGRRAMLAVLVFAGLRIGEMLALRWRDVDLAGGWLHVGKAKTDAGHRKVKIRGALRDELLAWRSAHRDAAQDAYVFPTLTGRRLGQDNFRNRVLGYPARTVNGKDKPAAGAIGQANRNLDAAGLAPLPVKLTPHGLRRTFCSVLYALGETPPVVMAEMGHADPSLALKVYAQAMRRDEHETAALRALVDGFGHSMDTKGAQRPLQGVERQAA